MNAKAQHSSPSPDDFHRAVDDHGDRWFGACLRITRDSGRAQDAVQDGLVSAWQKRDQFKSDARLETWIYRIVVNAALQALRRTQPDLVENLDEHPSVAQTPDRATDSGQIGGVLGSAVDRLTDFERACFLLKHVEEWRLREIADELDTKVSRVKQAVFRAVRKLRIEMAPWRSET